MADATVKIGADITALQAGLARGRAAVNSWGNEIGSTLKSGLAGALGVAAVGASLKGLVAEFSSVDDAAQKTGVSIRFLLSIKDEAQLAGTSLETAAKAVKKFLIELNDPKAGDKLNGVLKTLGTDVETLRQKKPEELFAVLSQAVGGVGSQADKLAVLGLLLGDTGGKFESLIPLLDKVAKDGVRPVSDEMVAATQAAAALEDEFDEAASGVKSVVLPVFLNFIKVMKLVGQFILSGLMLPFQQLGNLIDLIGGQFSALGDIIAGAMSLDRAQLDRGIEALKKNFGRAFDEIVETAKVHGKALESAFNDIGAGPQADPAAAPKAVNKALEEQIELLDGLSDAQKRAAKEADDAANAQVKSLKEYQDQLEAIRGKKKEKKEASIEDLNERLADLVKLKNDRGIIASNATQLGFGGRAVAEVSQNKVEQLIEATNQKLDERKAVEAQIVAKMDKILSGLL